MKVKIDHVINSSSTSYMITNKSNSPKDLVDFARENIHLFHEFLDEYDWYKKEKLYTEENFIASASMNNIQWKPYEIMECIFGDEQQTIVGNVFDYMLREGGSSENFSWYMHEMLR